LTIREAVETDIDQLTAIYNEVLTTSTAVYSDRPATLEERLAWWRSRREQSYPVLVAAEATTILGFATFGDFRTWPGYRFTVECTIHIHSSSRGQGIGTELLKQLVAHAKACGKHTMIAGVDSENQASLRFFQRFGFERTAHLREVGYKFDRFLDLIFLQYWPTTPKSGAPSQTAPPSEVGL
jgi:L-amino acid N-acyltransferase